MFFLSVLNSLKTVSTAIGNHFPYSLKFNKEKKKKKVEMMNPQTEKLVRRTTMVATVVASYFLLTADYGPEPNALDPIKRAILSAESSVKDFIFGAKKEPQESQKPSSDHH